MFLACPCIRGNYFFQDNETSSSCHDTPPVMYAPLVSTSSGMGPASRRKKEEKAGVLIDNAFLSLLLHLKQNWPVSSKVGVCYQMKGGRRRGYSQLKSPTESDVSCQFCVTCWMTGRNMEGGKGRMGLLFPGHRMGSNISSSACSARLG